MCCYCGNKPPAVVLEIDHIKPKSKKGTDNINNLITSCFECNRGKKNIELNTVTPRMSDNLEVLKEREKQYNEYQKYVKRIEMRMIKDINDIDLYFTSLYPGYYFKDNFRNGTIKRFLKYLSKNEIEEALMITYSKKPKPNEDTISYFCGICWNWIKNPEMKIYKKGGPGEDKDTSH